MELLEIAAIISDQDPAVLEELKDCVQDPLDYADDHYHNYALRFMGQDLDLIEPEVLMWIGLVDCLERKAHLKGQKVTKYKYLGLLIFVAIPLPGTGAWTGSLAAAFLDMPLRKALPSIFAGILIAGVAISVLTYGVASLF